ncbi:cytochrome-c oxidase, cbb3-type subunit III [Brackiella oedipodis]|uniref:cytochrome-c oxidase, cbb3-type subunit III n=1 Tax=Brackiella oedipodis TaxID=124225 RepID=UPI00048C1601|nr:cytochrome-c oxidase, cbb3-type subunit III [Brackiella oedipodis]
MNEFVHSGWSIWVAAVSILGVVFVLWLLWTQRRWLGTKTVVTKTGHEWDGVTELNHPIPRWWTVMYLGLVVIGICIMVLYPALGSFDGLTGFNSHKQVEEKLQEYRQTIAPVYKEFENMSIPEIAKNDKAHQIGERLFLNNCATCHGSDAKGAKNIPNLTDHDWLHGGEPENILQTITNGRYGVMAPLAAAVQPDDRVAIANYVRSLSGLSSDPTLLAQGKKGFETICAACHGVDGKGNQQIGAPNLTDNIWLGGNSVDTIVKTIEHGRTNVMPAQANHLTEDQIRMLAAYVWSFSNVEHSASE